MTDETCIFDLLDPCFGNVSCSPPVGPARKITDDDECFFRDDNTTHVATGDLVVTGALVVTDAPEAPVAPVPPEASEAPVPPTAPEHSGPGGRRYFVVDASARDVGGALVVFLYTKTPAGASETLRWSGQKLTFVVRWPTVHHRDSTEDICEWADRLRSHARDHPFEYRVVRRSHLMGFQASACTGEADRHLYVEITVGSLVDRRRVLTAIRPRTAAMRERAKAEGWSASFHEKCVDEGLVRGPLDIWHANTCAVQQAMVSHGGAPSMWITANPGARGAVRHVTFTPDDDAPAPPLRVLAFDIETGWAVGSLREGAFPQVSDPCGRIIEVGMYTQDGTTPVYNRVICLGDTLPPDGVETLCVANESELLDLFAEQIVATDPDCVTGYNICGFDWDWLAGRAELIDIFSRHATADAAVEDWQWAAAFMRDFPRKLGRDDLRRWLLARRDADAREHWDTRNGTCPDVTAERLASYREAHHVRSAWLYFHGLPVPSSFWFAGRGGTRSRLEVTTGKTGADQRRFTMEGRIELDLFPYMKEHFGDKLKSFSLKVVAAFFDPDTPKIDLDYHEMFRMHCSGCPAQKRTIAAYCARDCKIPAQLCGSLDVFVNLLELARVTGVCASQITRRGQQVRCLAQLYRICHGRDMVMNIRRQDQPGSFKGAKVQEPQKGYYRSVTIYEDFASLYPNIMRSYNFCYSTYVFPADLPAVQRAHDEGKLVLRAFETGDGRRHHFVQALDGPNLGVIPELLNNVLNARTRAKKALASAPDEHRRRVLDALQKALKVTANSIYGFTGVPTEIAMLPLSAIAEATTAQGRMLIDMCADVVPKTFEDLTLVYGDTDSVIFSTQTTDLHEGHAIGVAVETFLNEQILPSLGHYLRIECEEICSPYLQIMKKRYISRAFEHGPDKPGHVQYKGIELVRKDSLPFTNTLYKHIVDIIFGSGIGPTGPAKDTETIACEVVAYLREAFHKLYSRDACFAVSDFAQTKTLQNRSRYKYPDQLPHVVLMTRINREIESGTLVRPKFSGGDQITYVVRSGPGDITSRVDLPERVHSLDELDMLYYIDAARRALGKVLQFFISPAVETALFGTIRSTLFLRQTRSHSLLGDADRLANLKRKLDRAIGEATALAAPKPARLRQRTLFECT